MPITPRSLRWARTGALPEVIEVSHDYAKVMDKEQLLDRERDRQRD